MIRGRSRCLSLALTVGLMLRISVACALGVLVLASGCNTERDPNDRDASQRTSSSSPGATPTLTLRASCPLIEEEARFLIEDVGSLTPSSLRPIDKALAAVAAGGDSDTRAAVGVLRTTVKPWLHGPRAAGINKFERLNEMDDAVLTVEDRCIAAGAPEWTRY